MCFTQVLGNTIIDSNTFTSVLSSSFRTNHDKKKIREREREKEHVRFPSVHVSPGGGSWLFVMFCMFGCFRVYLSYSVELRSILRNIFWGLLEMGILIRSSFSLFNFFLQFCNILKNNFAIYFYFSIFFAILQYIEK